MEKKHSHLTLDERIVIEQGIKRKMSFSAIAASIGKDRSTVSREVQRNRKRYPGSAYIGRTPCKHTAEDCPVSRIERRTSAHQRGISMMRNMRTRGTGTSWSHHGRG